MPRISIRLGTVEHYTVIPFPDDPGIEKPPESSIREVGPETLADIRADLRAYSRLQWNLSAALNNRPTNTIKAPTPLEDVMVEEDHYKQIPPFCLRDFLAGFVICVLFFALLMEFAPGFFK